MSPEVEPPPATAGASASSRPHARLATLERLGAEAPGGAEPAHALVAPADGLCEALLAARRHRIASILPAPARAADPPEWALWLDWLARPDAADFFRTYLGPRPVFRWKRRIWRAYERAEALEQLSRILAEPGFAAQQRFEARLVLEELFNNALQHGQVRDPAAAEPAPAFELGPGQWVDVAIASAGNRLAIQIGDGAGALTADRLHEALHLQVSREGLHLPSGRGLFLVHQIAARLMIRVAPGCRTDVSVLMLKDPKAERTALARRDTRPLLYLGQTSSLGAPIS